MTGRSVRCDVLGARRGKSLTWTSHWGGAGQPAHRGTNTEWCVEEEEEEAGRVYGGR